MSTIICKADLDEALGLQWPVELTVGLGIGAWSDPVTYTVDNVLLSEAQGIPSIDEQALNVVCDKLEATLRRDRDLMQKFECILGIIDEHRRTRGSGPALRERRWVVAGWIGKYQYQIFLHQKELERLEGVLGERRSRRDYRVGGGSEPEREMGR
ncbi:hypothetical protein NMY22_g10532 [Coprinellus aureogranulatus]|nr:hypothetical protein NMY22_g10532 [Coprinellus aureogranulatus]